MTRSLKLHERIKKLIESVHSFITADAGSKPNAQHPGETGARYGNLDRAKKKVTQMQADLHANGVEHGMHVHEVTRYGGENTIKSTHTLTPAGKWHHHTKFAGQKMADPHVDATF